MERVGSQSAMTVDFTKEQKEQYFKNESLTCPECLSTNFVAVGNPIRDDRKSTCYQRMQCLICKKEWKDVYRRFDIELVTPDDELSNVKEMRGTKPKERKDG